MTPIRFASLNRVLCVGAHADDIEIGCGGSILRLLDEHPSLEVLWFVATSDPERKLEAERSAGLFLRDAQQSRLKILNFRDGFLPSQSSEVKEEFFHLRQDFSPDLVFTHRLEDRHQDHRLLAELTWNTFRSHRILEYEIPKYEGDLGQPNLYISVSRQQADRKLDLLMNCFATQSTKPWFDRETFEAMLRLRGLESKSDSKLAEGFTARKLVY